METFIPDEAETTTTTTTATDAKTPVADGYYWCNPVFATDTNRDGTPVDEHNIAVRITLKPVETAPLGGDGVPMDENCETATETIVIIYGEGGRVWDIPKATWRAATDADSEKQVAMLSRVFPAWAAFETDDPAEKIAWFVTHMDELRKCKVLCKMTNVTGKKDGKNYLNARICERTQKTVDMDALKAKLTRNQKAVLSKVMVKPSASAPAKIAPSAPAMPPEAPSENGEKESSKAECWQYYCEAHPSKGKDQDGWRRAIADVMAAVGKSREAEFTARDWGTVYAALCAEWVTF